MKNQDIIKAIAELDGWKPKYLSQESQGLNPPPYLTSRDAIIPVIEKKLSRHTCHSFFDALGLIAIVDWQDCDGAPSYEGDGSYFEQWVLFKAKPSQMCEALLRATGKWREE